MKKKRKLKRYIRLVIILIIFSLFFVLSLFMIYFSLKLDSKNSKSLLNYEVINDLDYKVYLKQNNYFSSNILPKNEQYIANIVDDIKPSFSYIFNSDKKFDYTYKYKIVGKLTADHNIDSSESKKVWEKDYVLLDEKTKKEKNSSGFVIRENIDIDYQRFSDYIQEFKKDYTLSITSNLNVYMIVDIKGSINGKDVSKSSKMSLDIPLSEQSFNITTNYKKNDTGEIQSKVNTSIIKDIYLGLGITLFIVSLVILITDLIRMHKYQLTHKKYDRELSKILGAYKDILVASKQLVDLSNYKIIDIEVFEDMLDVEQELRLPIIYKEVKEDSETWFIIINNDQAWRYILNNDSL